MLKRFCPMIVLCAAAGVASTTSAAVRGPYTVDSNTLHLYHLDETTTPAVDQAHYSYTGSFTPTRDANTPMTVLSGTGANIATLGNASAAGPNANFTSYNFGTSLSTANVTSLTGAYAANSVQPGLSALTPNNGTTDNVDHTFDNPNTHAFTMEAIVKVGFDPNGNFASPMEIVSGEGDAGDSSDRSWQFRIEPKGFNSRTVPALRFQKVSGFTASGSSTANYNLDANIPLTGVNAIVQNAWYHVAVTFNGSLTDPTNLKLYWSALDGSETQANLIGAGQMNGYLRQQDTDFGIGNEYRDFNGNTEPFIGQIDEVRFSDIARSATDMQIVPEPTTLAVLGLGGLVLRRRRA